jgi:leucyl aminopeptidase (aminopeptidase T)
MELKSQIKGTVIKMFKVNLGLRPKERVLILTDVPSKKDIQTKDPMIIIDMSERAVLARNVYEIGKKNFRQNEFYFFAFEATWQHGKEPYKDIASLMLEYDIIVAMTTFSLTHTEARKKACKNGARVASMPGVTKEMFYANGSINADYVKIKEYAKKWKNIIESSEEAFIKTKEGTNLNLILGKREFEIDDGMLTEPGSFGNLPAGEVCGAPISANGKLVVPRGWYPGLTQDLILEFKNGYVTKITGGRLVGREFVEKLGLKEKKIEKKKIRRRFIAELGIGLNPNAKKIDNILESEKIKGTLHIAIGDNTSFPGGKNKADIHQDFVIPKPTLIFDGKQVMENGKWEF